MRKIELMHHYFGRGEGQCRDCSHLQEGMYHDRVLRKCDVYGMTHSEASDWALKYPACGQKNKPYNGREMIRFVTPSNGVCKATAAEIDGQTEIESTVQIGGFDSE